LPAGSFTQGRAILFVTERVRGPLSHAFPRENSKC